MDLTSRALTLRFVLNQAYKTDAMLSMRQTTSAQRAMNRALPLIGEVILLLALLSAAGATQTPRGWSDCVGHETPDLVIEGCTEIIEEAQQPPAILALAYNNRGVAYKTKGAYDLALQDYNQAIQLSPSAANHYNNRGIIYRIKHEYDRAIADYDEAIWLKSDYVAAFYNRALAYTDKGDYDRHLPISASFSNSIPRARSRCTLVAQC